MAKIAGIYANGFGAPVPGVKLVLTARTTSVGVIMTTSAAQTTGADGSYSFDVLAGAYVVAASGSYLGVITVGTDSPDGTLNDYLAGYDPSALTPEIVQTVEELVKEAQAASTAATDSAAAARVSEDASIGSAGEAADSAAAAKQSEENAENYAKAAADSAAAVSAIKAPGEPGTYIFASTSLSTTGTPGSVYKGLGYTSGAHITPACLFQDVSGETDWVSIKNQRPDPPLAGTWSCCGVVVIGFSVTMWLRVDSPELLASGLRATLGQQRVRNCCYANPEGTAINCEISTTRGWLPFTATPDDSTEWGPKIYAAAVAGEYGEVLACGD
ncbi:TPA: prophage tail fiber N-terminal domain-containing protein [Salmonella enterica]